VGGALRDGGVVERDELVALLEPVRRRLALHAHDADRARRAAAAQLEAERAIACGGCVAVTVWILAL